MNSGHYEFRARHPSHRAVRRVRICSGGTHSVSLPVRHGKALALLGKSEAKLLIEGSASPTGTTCRSAPSEHRSTVPTQVSFSEGDGERTIVTVNRSWSIGERTIVTVMAEKTGVQCIRDVAMAVAHLHACGIVHRDIKPANLLLGADGRCVLGDMGLAEQRTSPSTQPPWQRSEQRLVKTTHLVEGTKGTYQYLSPEALEIGGSQFDGRAADVWALGITLCNFLTGVFPYDEYVAPEPEHDSVSPHGASLSMTRIFGGGGGVSTAVPPPPFQSYPSSPSSSGPASLELPRSRGATGSGTPVLQEYGRQSSGTESPVPTRARARTEEEAAQQVFETIQCFEVERTSWCLDPPDDDVHDVPMPSLGGGRGGGRGGGGEL
jgi:hypothetical protein